MKNYVSQYKTLVGVVLLTLIVVLHLCHAAGYYDLAHRKLASFFVLQTAMGKPEVSQGSTPSANE